MPLRIDMFTLPEIELIVSQEISLHPELGLDDVYKLLYQSHYGPDHISSDYRVVREEIHQELSLITPRNQSAIQDIGLGRGFLRFNLEYLSASTKSDKFTEYLNVLASLMLSSKIDKNSNMTPWPEIWRSALPSITSIIPCSDQEIQISIEMAACSDLPHHTQRYKEAYDPHYRVVDADQYHRSALKLISETL